jgi:hypothetical protein
MSGEQNNGLHIDIDILEKVFEQIIYSFFIGEIGEEVTEEQAEIVDILMNQSSSGIRESLQISDVVIKEFENLEAALRDRYIALTLFKAGMIRGALNERNRRRAMWGGVQ